MRVLDAKDRKDKWVENKKRSKENQKDDEANWKRKITTALRQR